MRQITGMEIRFLLKPVMKQPIENLMKKHITVWCIFQLIYVTNMDLKLLMS